MRIVEYQRKGVDIKTLPLTLLKAIDIQTPEEEQEIAQIIAEKTSGLPRQTNVSIEDIKLRVDKEIQLRTLTKEKEAEYQREIDERIAKANGVSVPMEQPIKLETEIPVEIKPEEVGIPIEAVIEELEEPKESEIVKKIKRVKRTKK